MLPHKVDITAITSKKVVGPPTSWQTQNGPFNVEHLAAVNASNEVLVFWWSPQHDWQAVNVSKKTGQKIVGGLTNWQTRNGPFLVEHLAGRTRTGDLIVFWWSPQHDWQAVNVSKKTGKRVLTSPTSWVTPDGVGGTVEHLAARDRDNHLLVFWWTPAHDWQVVDVTAKTGTKVSGEVTSWISHNGPMLVEHLAGAAPDGSLQVFWWSPAYDWQSLNVSSIAGGKVQGRPVSWLTGNVEHVAIRGTNRTLQVYWWTPTTNWRRVDVTDITGVQVAEVSAVYQFADQGQNVEVLHARSKDNALVRFWWQPNRDWQAANLSEAIGQGIAADCTAWTTPSGNALIEHAAAATAEQHLVLAWDDGEVRRLTNAVGEPLPPIKRVSGRRKVLAILWDPHRPTDPAPTPASVDDLIFGPGRSVVKYFLENSGDKYTIDCADLLGWFDASRPPEYWWGPADTTDANNDGWVHPHVQKWAEAIRFADAQFDYKAFDSNPFDGKLRPDELGILIVIPQNIPFGVNRPALSREFPNEQPLVVDNVAIGMIAEAYIGKPLNLGVVAHELGHLFLNLPDMHFISGFDNPFAAGAYSLMDNTYNGAHLDPFLKLKLGWMRPRVICRSGHYSLHAVESQQEVWILIHPQRGTREYFIVENRWPHSSFDVWQDKPKGQIDLGVPDQGLGVWHVIEDPQLYGTFIPPRPAATPQDLWEQRWAEIALDDWGRRGIRMIRPIWDTMRSATSLWDGSDPETGYDLLPDAAPPLASLRWADGTPSGFAIRNISPAGAVMAADIQVPW